MQYISYSRQVGRPFLVIALRYVFALLKLLRTGLVQIVSKGAMTGASPESKNAGLCRPAFFDSEKRLSAETFSNDLYQFPIKRS